jgi:hypothetical protein
VSSPKGLIETTGQMRTLYAGVWMAGLMGFLVLSIVLYSDQTSLDFVVILAALLAAVIVAVWVNFSVRCPNCGARLLWMAIRGQPASNWMSWLITQTACPVCSFEPEVKKGS